MQAGLRLQEPPERLSGLLREQQRLLKKIGHQKRDTARLRERIQEVAMGLAGEQNVVEECRRLDAEIHALFTELLARKRQPRGTHTLVAALYRMLQSAGVLTPRNPGQDWADELSDGPGPDGDGASTASGAGASSARGPGDEAAHQSLRGLFRDLATALHPDKVRDEDGKARHTEIMKEISRAYADRDLARLLDLKRIWLSGGTAASDHDQDEIGRRCANLERMNADLRVQSRQLGQELKELRRSPLAQVLRDVRRSPKGVGQDPVATLIAQARAELERSRELRDYVVSFRDGKITVDDFIRGPESLRHEAPDDDDQDLEQEMREAFMESLLREASAPRSPAQSRRRGRRQQDVPF